MLARGKCWGRLAEAVKFILHRQTSWAKCKRITSIAAKLLTTPRVAWCTIKGVECNRAGCFPKITVAWEVVHVNPSKAPSAPCARSGCASAVTHEENHMGRCIRHRES